MFRIALNWETRRRLGIFISFILLGITLFSLEGCDAQPDNIVKNFQKFSEEILALSSDSLEASETRPGINLYNPFGVGYLLANINEQLWNISTKGVPDALRVNEKYVAEDYGYLLGQLKRNKFKITSTVYSRFGNVTKTPGLSKLLSHLIALDFASRPIEFVDSFSSLLDLSTKGHLDNELLPKALWQQVFRNSTQGAYINTMYFKTKLDQQWTDIGERSFNYDAIVKFLETEGEFPVMQTDNLTAVVVTIQKTPSRQIVFVKPHAYIPFPELRAQIKEVLDSNVSWPLKKLRVQVPALNVTNLARYNLGMSQMGINETFCRTNETLGNNSTAEDLPTYVQQPITQASHFEFAPGYIEFASATGSIVTHQVDPSSEQGQDEDYELDYSQIALVNDNDEFDERAELNRKGRSPFERTMENVLKSDGKCEKPEEFSESHRISQSVIHDSDGKATLIFDTPFTWIIRDATLGQAVSGSVSSLCQYNKVAKAIRSSSAHAWLHDVFKVAFWKCA